MTDTPRDAPAAAPVERFQVADPHNRGDDPWSDFRSVDVLRLAWNQTFRHSFGKYSRFFQELENHRLLATRCPNCEMVWMPPRPVCPRDLTTTLWAELPGTGTLAGHTIVHRAPQATPWLPSPFVLAYADLDGADTLFLHVLEIDGDLSVVEYGMDIHVVYKEGPVAHPIWLMGLAPGRHGQATSRFGQEDVPTDQEAMD